MRRQLTQWLALIALFLLPLGCSEEPSVTPEADDAAEKPERAEFAEVLVEIGGPQHFPESEGRTALGVLWDIAEELTTEGVEVDPAFNRPDQLRLIVKPADQADSVYSNLKAQFDHAASEQVKTELAAQESIVQMKADEFQELQKLMKQIQQGLPVHLAGNDGKKLDRRQLDRLLETTLASQIEAEKRVEALQKQIDRERYAELLRVR